MVVYISEPKSFMSTDILTKNTSLKELQKSFQRLLEEDKDLNKMALLDREFKSFRFKAEQMTSDCVRVVFPDPHRIRERFFLLEGIL